MNETPVLQGHGVCLVPLRVEHLPALCQAQDADTWRWMSESGATPELMAGFVDRALWSAEAGTALVWTTTLPADGAGGNAEIAGCSRLAELDLQHRRGEIGWTWVAPKYRGAGLNARVKLLQLQHAFETMGLRRVALRTHHANRRSQRAMLKLGAQFEGTFRNHMLLADGTSRDTQWYSILDEEWPVLKARLLERIALERLYRR